MPTSEEARNQVAEASVLVSVQADCSVEEALVLMTERARVRNQSLKDIADDVIERRVWFDV